ncbi:Flp family type IVb pilin [Ensifer aridi]|uniref:Flp family type IVb pilin n=1 Tax=Ensifer aridi TaxID=1708715 RepID=UPI000614E56B|nr:Flp family type IVb pilin [Ensifer aridi]
MKTIFARLKKDESGATAIEYGLIAALISVALIGGATTLGGKLNTQFEELGKQLKYTATTSGTGGTGGTGGTQ